MQKSEQPADGAKSSAADGVVPSADPQSGNNAGVDSKKMTGPIKVRVIDDELHGLTFAHLTANSSVEEILADLTSPEVEELWSLVVSIEGSFKPLTEESPETVRQFLGSTRLVQDVLLSPQFREKASPQLLDPLAGFLQLADKVRMLKGQIEAAFPAMEFETTFSATRPSAHADLLQYDLLILDLVLNNSQGAVDELVEYLLAMGEAKYPAQIPPIIIMSNSPELVSERLRFSKGSQISAAGLMLLPKGKIREEGFGKDGLVLSYEQLDRQRGVAHHMRVFMRTWMKALENARENASSTLWNLDAAAMQQIHLSAITDDDPYDEHLNELMSREYLWHVESSPEVAAALEALDSSFTKQLVPDASPATIGTRFLAPIVDSKVGRELVSHFTWTGFRIPESVGTKSPKESLEAFNKLVPFGALLAPEGMTSESECLVHITQQCDLNAATRAKNLKNPVKSAQFAVVTPVEVVEHRMPDYKNDILVAKGLSIDGKEWDFKLAEGQQLALKIPKFIEHAVVEKLRVVGRLRHDIATHFLSATVNHMTRFASLKTTRIEVRSANVFLYGKKLLDGEPLMLKEADGTPVTVQFALHNKLYFFQDGASIRLALWIKGQVEKLFLSQKFDSAAMCSKLMVGLKDNWAITNVVDLSIKSFALKDLNGELAPAGAPEQKVRLVVVEIPQAAPSDEVDDQQQMTG